MSDVWVDSQVTGAVPLVRPGIVRGERPERAPERRSWLAYQDASIQHAIKKWRYRSFSRFGLTLEKIERVSEEFSSLNECSRRAFVQRLRQQLHDEGATRRLSIQVFGVVRTTAEQVLGLRPYDEQVFGGWLLLGGVLAEMETGEGKTLTATLPASTAAMTGSPVHVITANDYLVTRDADLMRPVYEALGLSVGTITATSTAEERRAAYGCDVTYVSNKQVVFDYLRDRQLHPGRVGSLRDRVSPLLGGEPEPPLIRGLCYAIVDEADSVLIDDARTPLILSQPQSLPIASTNYAVGLGLARRLTEGEDYLVDRKDRLVRLLPQGETRLEEMTRAVKGKWTNARYRGEFVTQALTALHVLTRNDSYLVKDGKIILIDENTGRAMPDRRLSHGLHQMVETKEGCSVTGQMETLGSISFQRFFRRYFHLAGMTGTAHEVSSELASVYGLPVVRVPSHRPSRREVRPVTLLASLEDRNRALVERVNEEQAEGRPVLIGTRTVAESEQISALLTESGLLHRVLNASQDEDEAHVVAGGGQRRSIIVATNMAGRGTDIPLGEGIAELGGLHVISTQLNDARRIDRQLIGRCGRQGDPGSFEALLSLDDVLLRDFYPAAVRSLLAHAVRGDRALWRRLGWMVARLPQWVKEHQHRRLRRAVLRRDEELEDLLAFSGFDS